MTTPERACPYCDTLVPEDTTICPGCHEDVAGLLHLAYAHVIYYNEALELAQQGETEQARETLLLSLRLNRNYAPAYALMARLAAQSEDWQEAREHAARAIALAPKDPALDALLEAIDEGEARSRAARTDGAAQRARQQRAAAERFLAQRQRQVLQAALFGAVVGGALGELVRWLLGRRAGNSAG
jgi:tetratricopeptide (TPR) repeat protein